jgi:hypothetical protein
MFYEMSSTALSNISGSEVKTSTAVIINREFGFPLCFNSSKSNDFLTFLLIANGHRDMSIFPDENNPGQFRRTLDN